MDRIVLNKGLDKKVNFLNSSICAGSHLNKINLKDIDKVNASIDALTNNYKEVMDENDYQIDLLNMNIDAISSHETSFNNLNPHKEGTHEKNYETVPLNTNVYAISTDEVLLDCSLEDENISSYALNRSKCISPEKKLVILEKPIVDITSSEQSNGRFQVKIHIKGFEKIEQTTAKPKFNNVNKNILFQDSTNETDIVDVRQPKTIKSKSNIVESYLHDNADKENYYNKKYSNVAKKPSNIKIDTSRITFRDSQNYKIYTKKINKCSALTNDIKSIYNSSKGPCISTTTLNSNAKASSEFRRKLFS